MNKAMIFIDGTWLYKNQHTLEREFGEDYKIDYEKLPTVISNILAKQVGRDVMVVRTYFYCSIPTKFNPIDQPAVDIQQDFFNLLKEEFHYEVETYPIDFHGRRLRYQDRVAENPTDEFNPAEKCVDIALATGMLYFAAIPYAYDIAIAVVGDEDFRPVLQTVRNLGRRVAIATIRSNALAFQYRDPLDAARIRDFDTIFMNDYLVDLQLKVERRQVECAGRSHIGNRMVYTTARLRGDRPFFCEKCRSDYKAEQANVESRVQTQMAVLPTLDTNVFGSRIPGILYKIVRDKLVGYVRAVSGKEYYFFASELEGVSYEDLKEMDVLAFEVLSEPNVDPSRKQSAGKCRKGVRRVPVPQPGQV